MARSERYNLLIGERCNLSGANGLELRRCQHLKITGFNCCDLRGSQRHDLLIQETRHLGRCESLNLLTDQTANLGRRERPEVDGLNGRNLLRHQSLNLAGQQRDKLRLIKRNNL